ncbi:hypothetical protein HHK36_013100 [Tetracentron sinense]|uniref:Uncharacterized protein n=1 Tax=Tetracentron sinense TaxID=13715 RepID=A0A835DG61_TETSI|nr:hypothetical protein HHK36_013100 [Tetracentron sinense]
MLSNKRPISLFFFLLVITVLSTIVSAAQRSNIAYAPCNGSIAECYEEDEMLMESEISRRFLEEKKYITPGALNKDKPVCRGGASGEAYTKTGGCLPPPANPEDRGCSRYQQCRKGS